MGSNNEEIVKAIQHYQDRLDRYVSSKSNDKILYALKKLEKLPVRTVHLEETGVGRTVNALKKCGGLVGEAAKRMVAKWKMMVLEEEQAADEGDVVNEEEEEAVDSAVESAPDSSYASENENYKVEKFEMELNDLKDVDFSSSHKAHKIDKNEINVKDYYGESSNKYEEHSIKNKSENKIECDIENENKLDKKRKGDEVRSSDLESTKHRKDDSKQRNSNHGEDEKRKSKHEKSHSKRKRDSSESDSEDERKQKSKKSHHRRDDSSDSENGHKKHKSKSSKENKDSSKSKSKEKTGSDKQSKEKSDKSKKQDEGKSSSEHSDKRDSSSKHESKSSRHDKESHKSKSHSSEKKDKHKQEESSKKSKDKHKSKERESTKKEKSSSSSKQSEKDKSNNSSSSSSKHKPSSSSSSNSTGTEYSESKSKVTKEKTASTKTSKIVNGIDSESGASFAEALGMCGPMPVINKAASSKKKLTSLVEKPESSQAHNSKSVSPTDESTVEKYVPEALKEPHLEPLSLNIDNLLPEISPNYRPLGFPLDNQPKRIMTDDEALSKVMSNRNQKTKVYSGNKTRGKVESLFDLCVRILQDNIDALEYTGGVPYSILKAILERATPDQLFNMEHHNPYLIEDTDELWQLHCQKEFRTKKREELESWREMYMRCLDEREARLTAITANIKQSQDKSLPVRTTKLAYVDSVAKPPRNIARKQVKNGIINEQKPSTATKLNALATSGEAGKISVPNPGSRAADRSSHSGPSAAALKPKKAPLMAKTLSFLKNRFRR